MVLQFMQYCNDGVYIPENGILLWKRDAVLPSLDDELPMADRKEWGDIVSSCHLCLPSLSAISTKDATVTSNGRRLLLQKACA